MTKEEAIDSIASFYKLTNAEELYNVIPNWLNPWERFICMVAYLEGYKTGKHQTGERG